ncbi:Unknown protein [Striga hermonthica]|uniref:DUF4216 domain-containing protein n=1 Tax=Striga hermonthica TaxID=68872 RepID=A0A9N7NNE4_STRHE|nr:Unknown protein [Striga hermonthica]
MKERDDKSTTQNSGVSVVAESMHFSSSKDKNPLLAAGSYYGVIDEIWEISYIKFTVPVFKCKWVDGNNGVRVDDLGVILVDFSREGYKNEPFVMACQAKQVFYVSDPSDQHWSVVLQGKRQLVDDTDEPSLDMYEFPTLSPRSRHEDIGMAELHLVFMVKEMGVALPLDEKDDRFVATAEPENWVMELMDSEANPSSFLLLMKDV